MDPNLTAIFTEAEAPTHATLDDVLAQLQPIVELAAQVQMQVAAHRQLVLTAQVAPATADMDGDLDRLHQTLDALEADVKAMITCARRVKTGVMQYARYSGQIRELATTKLEAPPVAIDGIATV